MTKLYSWFLGSLVLLGVFLLSVSLIFAQSPWIKTSIGPWAYYLFFFIPILLAISASHLKKRNDIRGRNLCYLAIISFIASVFAPIFFLVLLGLLGLTSSSLVLVAIFPTIAVVLSLVVVGRLFSGKAPFVVLNSSVSEHPYR